MDHFAFPRKLAIIGFYFAGFLVIISTLAVNYSAFFISSILMLANLWFWQFMEGNL